MDNALNFLNCKYFRVWFSVVINSLISLDTNESKVLDNIISILSWIKSLLWAWVEGRVLTLWAIEYICTHMQTSHVQINEKMFSFIWYWRIEDGNHNELLPHSSRILFKKSQKWNSHWAMQENCVEFYKTKQNIT